MKAGVVKPIDAVDDLASTDVENMRDQELVKAAHAALSSTAATSTTLTDIAATDTAKETRTQKTRKSRTRRGQKPPCHAPKCLQSPQSPIDDISRGNDLVDEYVHNTQKYQTAKAEVVHQQGRVEWVRSEISKIMIEQKAAGKSSNSVGTRSRERKPTDDVDPKQPVAKHRWTDKTTKLAADQSRNRQTTQSKKRTLPHR